MLLSEHSWILSSGQCNTTSQWCFRWKKEEPFFNFNQGGILIHQYQSLPASLSPQQQQMHYDHNHSYCNNYNSFWDTNLLHWHKVNNGQWRKPPRTVSFEMQQLHPTMINITIIINTIVTPLPSYFQKHHVVVCLETTLQQGLTTPLPIDL